MNTKKKMKTTKIFNIVLLLLFFVSACNLFEPDKSMIAPLSASKINSVKIAGKQVTVNVTYFLPNPCWHYYKTVSYNNDSVFTSKVFGKYNGETCIQMVSSFEHSQKINFSTRGEKLLRFWKNDSTFSDTTITIIS